MNDESPTSYSVKGIQGRGLDRTMVMGCSWAVRAIQGNSSFQSRMRIHLRGLDGRWTMWESCSCLNAER